MQISALISLYSSAYAATVSQSADAATDTSVNAANVDAAVDIADSTEIVNEKRWFGLIAAKWHWAHSLLNRGICYGCGYSNLGCGYACCRCGATTQITCINC